MALFGKKKETVSVTFVSHAGDAKTVPVEVGETIKDGALDNGIEGIVAECGGAGQCATCHVYVDEAFAARLRPPDDNEDEMLRETFSERKPNSRLSCQIYALKELDGMIVHIPEAQQ
jgi:2Fe-2S ferredoxin